MRNFLATLVLLTAASSSFAADSIKIRDVRLGFVNSSNANEDLYKAGTWTPVTVEIENLIVGEKFEGTLTVETADSDGVLTRFSPRKVFIDKNEGRRSYLTYIKVSGSSAEVHVHVEGKIGSANYQTSFNYPGDRMARVTSALQPEHKMVLALGDPKGLEKPLADEGNEAWKLGANWFAGSQSNVNLLPDKWFGYEGVDIIILPTGANWALAKDLASDQLKREALARWVEMGGHLVISVSANHSLVGNPTSFPLEPLLPARIDTTGTFKMERLENLRKLVDGRVPSERRFHANSAIKSLGTEVAQFRGRQPFRVVAEEENPRLPIIIEGSRGMGRITLLGFDTDQGPFTVWENRRDFWMALFEIKPVSSEASNPRWRGGGVWVGGEGGDNDLASQLCTQLEQFGEVRVIPFSWVALFIFVYILIVGPLDYIILKKVVKRLEWTWITFPLVVLGVSLGAYFLAHYLKGNELRINKVDVVDIDTHTQQAYGTSWFTIFSPRLQHYDFGVEPAGFKYAESSVVSWMGRPGYGARAFGGRQSPGLFYRSYEYENEAQSLKGVPIQVWSMKTFTARWQAPLDANKPLIRHDLKTDDHAKPVGTITLEMPYTLHSCQLIFHGDVWELGDLNPGEAKRLPNQYSQARDMARNWGGGFVPIVNPRRPRGYGQDSAIIGSTTGLVRQMMFHEEITRNQGNQSAERSNYLNYLDQSWRLQAPEAILIGLLDDEDGSSTEINDAEHVGSRFTGFNPKLRGTMKQSTVVRFYLPLK
jgi:hypothetical protein